MRERSSTEGEANVSKRAEGRCAQEEHEECERAVSCGDTVRDRHSSAGYVVCLPAASESAVSSPAVGRAVPNRERSFVANPFGRVRRGTLSDFLAGSATRFWTGDARIFRAASLIPRADNAREE